MGEKTLHKEEADAVRSHIRLIEAEIEDDKASKLYDSTRFFEVFAFLVCSAWFHGMQVDDLNKGGKQNPYVDLKIGEDMYVQVTTQMKGLSGKVKNAVDGIAGSGARRLLLFTYKEPDEELNTYTAESLSFKPETDVISTDLVKRKVVDDPAFCQRIYTKLLAFVDDVDKCKEKIEESDHLAKQMTQGVISKSIFNREMNIDMSHVLVINGKGGIGKTTLAVSLMKGNVKGKNIILGKRNFMNAISLQDVLGFDLKLFLRISKDGLMIVVEDIDKLEFDDLNNAIMRDLYSLAINNGNFNLVITCGDGSRKWREFIRKTFEGAISFDIPLLSDQELRRISVEHEVLRLALENHPISDVIRVPLFLALFLANGYSHDAISSLNSFRHAVWDEIDEGNGRGRVFMQILFDCIRNSTPDASKDKYPSDVVQTLIRDGYLIEGEEYRISSASSFFNEVVLFHYFEQAYRDAGKDISTFVGRFNSAFSVEKTYLVRWLCEAISNDSDLACSVIEAYLDGCDDILLLQAIAQAENIYDDLLQYENELILKSRLETLILGIRNFGLRYDGHRPTPCGDLRILLMNTSSSLVDHGIKVDYACEYAGYPGVDNNKGHVAAELLSTYILSTVTAGCLPLPCGMKEKVIALSRLTYKASDVVEGFLKEIAQLDLTSSVVIEIYLMVLDSSCWRYADLFPEKMTEISSRFWFCAEGDNSNFLSTEQSYGLRDVSSFCHSLAADYSFYCVLLLHNFHDGLIWMLSFFNRAVEYCSQAVPEQLERLSIRCPDGKMREYFGNLHLWTLHTCREVGSRVLMGLSFSFRKVFTLMIEKLIAEGGDVPLFAFEVRRIVLEESNNVIPISILSTVGSEYIDVLPGFDIPFATDVRMIKWDFHRNIVINSSVHVPGMEPVWKFVDHIAEICPDLSQYSVLAEARKDMSLTQTFQQYYSIDDDIANQCSEAVAVLKEKIDRENSDEEEYYIWQIDLHKEADGRYYGCLPVDGAKRYHDLLVQDVNEICTDLHISHLVSAREMSLEECDNLIHRKQDSPYVSVSDAILYALGFEELELEKRNEYISLIPDGLSLFPVEEQTILKILLKQTEFPLSRESHGKVLKLVYSSLFNNRGLFQYANVLKAYPKVAVRLFNACVAHATIYRGQLQTGPENHLESFQSYLYEDKDIDVSRIRFEECEMNIMVLAFYCGMTLADNRMRAFTLSFMRFLVCRSAPLSNSLPICVFLSQSLVDGYVEDVLDIMVGSTNDISTIPKWMVVLYYKSFDLSSRYYDGWRDVSGKNRKMIEENIRCIEARMNQMPSCSLRDALELDAMLVPSCLPSCWIGIETSYSRHDKRFLCLQYKKYEKKHPKAVLHSILGLNMVKLMPEVLPIVDRAVSAGADSIELNGYLLVHMMKSATEDASLLKSIKSKKGYHDAYISILDQLCSIGITTALGVKELFVQYVP